MSDAATWQANNTRQLGAALAELREQLERIGAPKETAPPATPAAMTAAPTPAETTARSSPWALDLLGERLGLSPFERRVLFLAAAMELDTRIPALCAKAQDDARKPFPTLALALAAFPEAAWDAFAPDGALRYWRLIEVQPGGMPLTARAIQADERIVNYLKGLNHLDERLAAYIVPFSHEAVPVLAPSQQRKVDFILHRWRAGRDDGPLPLVQLVGSDGASRQAVARNVALQLKRQIFRMPVELLPGNPIDLDTVARLWQREDRLLPVALYLDAEDIAGAPPSAASALGQFLARSDGLFFLGAREALADAGRSSFAVDVSRPNSVEQQAAWTGILGTAQAAAAARLAAQFNLNLAEIQRIGVLARADADEARPLSDATWALCRTNERPRLGLLAQRLEPKVAWEDLVLPAAEKNLLRQIVAQVGHRQTVYGDWGLARKMNRGFGISALFAGDSGTGKTMAAEVIAHELKLDLYRIDLSQVVNKYIGETEKNLRRLFDAAEDGGAILFFDEADALFGKRSEVRDSHDRYANIEINYLLQRIESFGGLAILATNMKSGLDPAFLRRLRFVVNFPFPGPADRRRLWEQVFLQPDAKQDLPAPPLAELDYERLARLNLSPGCIHNAAVNACFLAAESGGPVTMPLALEAARAEFLKLGQTINETDFRWRPPVTAGAPAKPSAAR